MEAGISDLISMLTDIAQAGAEKHLKVKEQLRSAADRSTCDDSDPLPPLRNLLELADPNTLLHTLAGNWRDHDD